MSNNNRLSKQTTKIGITRLMSTTSTSHATSTQSPCALRLSCLSSSSHMFIHRVSTLCSCVREGSDDCPGATPRCADGNFPPFVHGMECPFVSTNARQRAFLCTATYLGSAQMTTRRDSTQGSRETHVHTESKTDRQKDSDRDTIRENGKRRTETLDTLCRRCTLCYRQPCTHIYQGVPKKTVVTRC